MHLRPLSHLTPYWSTPPPHSLEDNTTKQLTMMEIMEKRLATFIKLKWVFITIALQFINCQIKHTTFTGMKRDVLMWQDNRKDGMNLHKSCCNMHSKTCIVQIHYGCYVKACWKLEWHNIVLAVNCASAIYGMSKVLIVAVNELQ